jgi:hypothetical protein
MIVIRMNGGLNPITVDSTEITVDSTVITVDNNISGFGGDGYLIRFIPRYYVEFINVMLRNELNNEELTQTVTMTENNGLCECIVEIPNLEDNTNFEIVVTDTDDNLLFRGKAFSTTQNDLENFKLNVPNQNNKIIM